MTLPPFGPKLDRLFCGKDCPKHVDVELTMELILGDVFQRQGICVDAGIVHQHVERAEGLFGFVKQPPHVGGFGDVALDGNGLTAVGVDVSDDAVRALLAGRIVHHHCGARRTQALGDSRADALRRTGHDRYLAFQIAHWNSSWSPLQPLKGYCRNMSSGRYHKVEDRP